MKKLAIIGTVVTVGALVGNKLGDFFVRWRKSGEVETQAADQGVPISFG